MVYMTAQLAFTEKEYDYITVQCRKCDVSDQFMQRVAHKLLTNDDANTLRSILSFGTYNETLNNKLNALTDNEIAVIDDIRVPEVHQERIFEGVQAGLDKGYMRVAVEYPYHDNVWWDYGVTRLKKMLELQFPMHKIECSHSRDDSGRYTYRTSICRPEYIPINGTEKFYSCR